MNIQILPNWFKKIALIVFIVGFFVSQGDDLSRGFISGMNQSTYTYETNGMDNGIIEIFVGGQKGIHLFKIITLIALLTFLISKEKIEDDYIKLLRLESYQLSFLIIVIVAFIFYVFGKQTLYDLFDSVEMFLMLYLIIFFFKKRLN